MTNRNAVGQRKENRGEGERMNTLLHEALSVKVPLQFSADGKFRILMVSDIHGGRGSGSAATDFSAIMPAIRTISAAAA